MNEEKNVDKTAIELRRDYYRHWRAENKDKVREHNRRYWIKQAQKAIEQEGKRNETVSVD